MTPPIDTFSIDRLVSGVAAASDAGRTRLVSLTAAIPDTDVCAAILGSRLASDSWFCWEEVDRHFALGCLGSAVSVVARGERRFEEVADRCMDAISDAELLGETVLPSGAGIVWVGGFSFDPEGGRTSKWSSFAPGSMTLPEIALSSHGDQTFLTLNVLARPGQDPEQVRRRISARVAALSDRELPMLDPHPVARPDIRSTLPPGGFERAVTAAVERMAAGEDGITKLVLAREVVVEAASAHDPDALFGALRQVFPSCFAFSVGTPEGAFIGASPELLIRRSGASVSAVALAGSTRRSSDPSVDDHLGEQLLRSDKDRREHEIVVRRITSILRPHSVWVEAGSEPTTIRVANIQHLATPIVAQLSDSRSAIELAGMLHPTPAVGGEPWPEAGRLIRELEEMDRGWYAGPVGWMDATEDGEFCVALRSALIRDREAFLFAGVGVVAGSDPASELAETEVKLGALLPLLAE